MGHRITAPVDSYFVLATLLLIIPGTGHQGAAGRNKMGNYRQGQDMV